MRDHLSGCTVTGTETGGRVGRSPVRAKTTEVATDGAWYQAPEIGGRHRGLSTGGGSNLLLFLLGVLKGLLSVRSVRPPPRPARPRSDALP